MGSSPLFDTEAAARRIRLENDKETQELILYRSRAQEAGRKLAQDIISAHPEVGKIWGFGSTFETWRSFRMTSDIDLAVESGDILTLLSLVENKGFPVDLVDLSSCDASMADFIRAQGIILAGE